MKPYSLTTSIKHTVMVIACLLAAGGWFSAAATDLQQEAAPSTSAPETLNATIMEIDLAHNRMVVAEKEILLLATMQDGAKVWLTTFQDATGKAIPPEALQQWDRVVITGRTVPYQQSEGGLGIEARQVTLTTIYAGNKQGNPSGQSKPAQENKEINKEIKAAPPPAAVPLRQENGVWKN